MFQDFFKKDLPSKRQNYRDENGEKEIFHLLVHYADGHNVQDWARSGARNLFQVSGVNASSQVLQPSQDH